MASPFSWPAIIMSPVYYVNLALMLSAVVEMVYGVIKVNRQLISDTLFVRLCHV